jgi:HEAT repeat protein
MFEDEDHEVRRAAIRAAGKLCNPKLLPSLVSLLSEVSLRQSAAAALVDFHESALPDLQERLRDPALTGSIATRILHVVGQIGGASADDILCDQLDHPSWEIQSASYHALSRSGFRAQTERVERIESCLLREAKRAAWCWGAFEDIAGLADGSDIIRKALKEDIRRCEDNLFHLLSCLYPVTSIQAARRGLRSDSPDVRAKALEILDSVVDPGTRGFVVALLDDFSPSDRLEALDKYLPQSRSDVTKRLGQIIDARSPVGVWTRLCSLYVIGKSRLTGFKTELDPHLEAPLNAVRETARWAHARL